MSWAKVDDGLYDDPRSESAGVDAMGLWVFALSYMARYSTDGWITLERCRRFAGRRARGLAGRLVASGWWEEHEGGEAFCLVGWEAFLIPRADVEQRSAKASEAGRKGGEAKARRARELTEPIANRSRTENEVPTSGPSSLEVREVVPECKPAEALETALATRAPDPDPTRPNTESAPARACVCPEPSATLTPLPSSGMRSKVQGEEVGAPALPGLEGLVVPKAESDAAAVWAAYLEGRVLVGPKGPPPVLDSKRRRLIATRLKDGFTLADLCDAARGIWRADWWVENKRTALDYAIRDATRIEEFRLLGRKRPADPPRPAPEAPRALNRPPSNVTLEEAIAAIRANPYFPQPERTIAGLQAKIALRDAAKAEGQAAHG